MYIKPVFITLFLSSLILCNSAKAQDNTAYTNKQDEAYGEAFVNYKPYTKAIDKKKEELPKVSTPTPPKEQGKEAVTVEWLRTNYPILEDRAINNPTEENVSAYLYTKRIILDKSQQFSNMVVKVNNNDPILNENNRVPTASGGALSIRNANYLAQSQAVRELSKQGGLLIFVDGHCRFCTQEIPVLESVRKSLGMEYLVITTDGTLPKNFKGIAKTDNGMFQKLGLKLTPSVVYVPNPKSYTSNVDPNKYFIIAQGFYAKDDLTKQIAYAGHDSKLLTSDTMKDLNVWDRGVATTDDLLSLKLDVNKPESFKQSLQPILIKQYK